MLSKRAVAMIIYLVLIAAYFMYAFTPGNHITMIWQAYYQIVISSVIIWAFIELRRRTNGANEKRLYNVGIGVNVYTIIFFVVKFFWPTFIKLHKDAGHINYLIVLLIAIGSFYLTFKHFKK